MKLRKLTLSLLSLALSFTLFGCAKDNNNQDQASEEIQNTLWEQPLKDKMMEVVGHILPYIPLENVKYEVVENHLHVYEDGGNDLNASQLYREECEKNGYTKVCYDNNKFTHYYREYRDHSAVNLQVIYQRKSLNNEEIKNGVHIFAKGLKVVNDWSEAEKTSQKINLQHELPAPKMHEDHIAIYDNEADAYCFRDVYMTNEQVKDYYHKLKDNGFTIDRSGIEEQYDDVNDDELPYARYVKPSKISEKNVLTCLVYNYNLLGARGVELYFQHYTNYQKVSEWPKEAIDTYFNHHEGIASIPAYTNSDLFLYVSGDDDFEIHFKATSEQFEAYLNLVKQGAYTYSYNSLYDSHNLKSNDNTYAISFIYNVAAKVCQMDIYLLTE